MFTVAIIMLVMSSSLIMLGIGTTFVDIAEGTRDSISSDLCGLTVCILWLATSILFFYCSSLVCWCLQASCPKIVL